jgi:DNA adenine methylase
MSIIKHVDPPKPFLRWAGGKKWFVRYLNGLIPNQFKDYHEPFLGGGSVFFNIKSENNYYLSDLNTDLINTYIQVRDSIEDVICHLQKFKNTAKDYYEIRNKIYTSNSLRAAQFIYLNKTSFNGIYRVNRQGRYNVPFGYRENVDHVDASSLRSASKALKDVFLNSQDFQISLAKVKKSDFVFIDPPYTVAHENNGFIAYNQKLFSLEDQYKLAECLKVLNKIGAYFILTNAFHKTIRDIYDGTGDFYYLERKSLIGGRGANRDNIKEYIIKNF